MDQPQPGSADDADTAAPAASDDSLLGAKGDPVEGARHIPEGPQENDSDADRDAEDTAH